MDTRIYTKGIGLNAQAESYIQRKLNRLGRHLRSISDARLDISRTSSRSQDERIVVQMTLDTAGRTLRGQGKGINLFAAIDAVVDAMDRQVETYKGKYYRSSQSKRAARVNIDALSGTIDEGGEKSDEP